MKLKEALKVFENYPDPLSITIEISDDDMISVTVTPYGDPLTVISCTYGPGSLHGAIVEMAENLKIMEAE